MTEIKKDVWLRNGLKLLDASGRNSLKISNLCKKLDLTKGSFYHWFQSKSDFDLQLLQYWREIFTSEFIKEADAGNSSKERLRLLILNCIDSMKAESRLEIEINMWAQQEPKIGEFVRSVYEERFNYLLKLLADIYALEKKINKHALVLYSLMIGVDLFYRKLSKEELYLIFEDYLIEP
ncbi:TetR/AcrR family transcriptional regulator [bacterium]|nr:TetR/AcrR family transcriptional regulator [bacterium]